MEKRGTVILVEDSPITNDYVCALLLKHNYSVVSFLTGAEALSYFDENSNFDLVLLDVVLPDTSGFEIIQKIKQNKKINSVPIIFLTSISDKRNIIKGLQLGAVDYLTKPFNEAEILLRIRTHLKLFKTQSLLKTELVKRREQEKKINQQNKQLRDLNLTKDKFFSILAHDLKNPIYGFVGLTKLLLRDEKYDKDRLKEIITVIHNSSKNIQSLLDTLLDWGRFHTNKIRFEPVATNIFQITFDIVSLYKNIANDKNIKIEINIPENLILLVDNFMINAIIRNLISNGLKFTANGGSIFVFTTEDEKTVNIHIKDTGVGIKPEKIKQLFDLEKSISTTGTENEKGSGLGLILCKEFVEKHKGRIEVVSKPKKGTTFTCIFPKS